MSKIHLIMAGSTIKFICLLKLKKILFASHLYLKEILPAEQRNTCNETNGLKKKIDNLIMSLSLMTKGRLIRQLLNFTVHFFSEMTLKTIKAWVRFFIAALIQVCSWSLMQVLENKKVHCQVLIKASQKWMSRL